MSFKDFIDSTQNSSPQDAMSNISFTPTIEIDKEVFKKIMYWIDKTGAEISGLGKVLVDKERNVIRVIEAVLVKQENTGTSTELDAAAVGRAMFRLKDSPGELRFHFHSHANMGVFWSSTDQDMIKMLGSQGWFCATVFNKKREMLSAYVQASPVRFVCSDVPTTVDKDTYINEAWDKEYAENVTEKTYTALNVDELERLAHSGADMSDLVAEYHKRWPEEDVDETCRAIGFTQNAVEPEEEDTCQAVEMTEEQYKEYSDSCDVLFQRHKCGQISSEQLDSAINQINAKYGFDTSTDEEEIEVTSSEEARAMDIGEVLSGQYDDKD